MREIPADDEVDTILHGELKMFTHFSDWLHEIPTKIHHENLRHDAIIPIGIVFYYALDVIRPDLCNQIVANPAMTPFLRDTPRSEQVIMNSQYIQRWELMTDEVQHQWVPIARYSWCDTLTTDNCWGCGYEVWVESFKHRPGWSNWQPDGDNLCIGCRYIVWHQQALAEQEAEEARMNEEKLARNKLWVSNPWVSRPAVG